MDLIKFRVTMYKGIIDSDWVDVDHLTVLVGKNESGKTSLLRALHKLNPYNPEPDQNNPDFYDENNPDSYQIDWEWPRALLHDQDAESVVCRAKFKLSDPEKSDIAQIAGIEKIPDTVEVTRNYAGKLEIHWEEDMLLGELSPHDLDNALGFLPKVYDEFGDQFKEVAQKALDEARWLASEGKGPELLELVPKYGQLLFEVISSHDPPHYIEQEFIDRFASDMPRVIDELTRSLSIQSQLNQYIATHLPTFIYMDDYRAFTGTAQLDEIQSRQSSGSLTEEDRTLLTILSLSKLDLDELVRLGQGGEREKAKRQHIVDAGSHTLTKILADRLQPRNYVVDHRVDAQGFFTRLKDNVDTFPIELEERSKGFQWIFSFELMFTHESNGSFKNCVILLDEPGLHLHPNAQTKLLDSLEIYAKENTLLYTTHLPFMIDLSHPERIRVLKETDDGITVTTDLIDTSSESKFVLQAALGMSLSANGLIEKRNLVVEGVDDYLVIAALSDLLQESEEKRLPEDIRITPAGGASEVVRLATFMIGQELDVVVLLDSDKAGENAKEKLDHQWITWYTKQQTKVVMLGEAVGASDDFAIEDMFPKDFYIKAVEEVYSKQLKDKGINEITLQGKDMLSNQVGRFMKDNNVKFNKGSVAKRLVRKIRGMQDSSELPCKTRNYAIKLFQEISNALHKKKTQKS